MSPCSMIWSQSGIWVWGQHLTHTSSNEQSSTAQMLQLWFSFPKKWINEILWFFMTFPRFNDFFIDLWPKSKFYDFLKFYDPWNTCWCQKQIFIQFFPLQIFLQIKLKKKKKKKNTDTHYVICYIDTDNVYVYVSMSM